MDNYKIKVKDEAESKEAQELFFALGASRPDGTKNTYHSPTVFGLLVVDGLLNYVFAESVFYDSKAKELPLPQLRDLVVLKRNDVKDAAHRDKRDESIYLTSDKVIYYWQGEWCKSAINKSNDYENYIANSLTPIAQPQDPALISGADALRALADGKEVEYLYCDEEWIDASELQVKHFNSDCFTFRIKKRLIQIDGNEYTKEGAYAYLDKFYGGSTQ